MTRIRMWLLPHLVCFSPSLLTHEYRFCNLHNNQNAELQDEWLLHRDIIHGLIVPVVELINRASTLAGAALCSDKPEDMELVFRGDARGAFVTLQCFQSEEEDWCYSRGCPGTYLCLQPQHQKDEQARACADP